MQFPRQMLCSRYLLRSYLRSGRITGTLQKDQRGILYSLIANLYDLWIRKINNNIRHPKEIILFDNALQSFSRLHKCLICSHRKQTVQIIFTTIYSSRWKPYQKANFASFPSSASPPFPFSSSLNCSRSSWIHTSLMLGLRPRFRTNHPRNHRL